MLAEFEFEMPDLSAPEAEVSVRPEVVLGVEERRIVEQLWVGPLQVDELGRACAIASPVLSGILLSLEMKRIVRTLPGGVIELATDVRRVNKVESTNE